MFATKLCLLTTLTFAIASADSLTVVNPNFANVAVQCGTGYAYQSVIGGNCAGPTAPQQDFNSGIGVGWTFSTQGDVLSAVPGTGISKPNTAFDPPSFTGFPFSQATLLQGLSASGLTIPGFVRGGVYTLSFYLGSRYANASTFDGNQTVVATLDNQLIGSWPLVSFTPFTPRTVEFTVSRGGSHTLKFAGIATGDHTAFFSGVSIVTGSSLTVKPSPAFPGMHVVVSAGGFAPLETVTLIGYAHTPVVIGTPTTDASGNATVQVAIPQTPFGTCGLQFIGQSSGTVASGTISITPRLLVNPISGTIGDPIAVSGLGFAAGEKVIVNWLSPQTFLGSITTDVSGSFSGLAIVIPAGVSPGSDGIVATGQRSGAVAGAKITVQ